MDDYDVDIEEDEEDEEELENIDTVYDLLKDREGQTLTLGEFNTILQGIFGEYTTVYLQANDLPEDENKIEDMTLFDDENNMFTLYYKFWMNHDDEYVEIVKVEEG